jgi:hypothetical protein
MMIAPAIWDALMGVVVVQILAMILHALGTVAMRVGPTVDLLVPPPILAMVD